MNRLKHWLRYPLRYRTGRGFGIHSPFAFRFVREVLMEKLPYYVYHDVSDAGLRLIFRLACYFRPSDVLILGDGADAVAAVLRRYDSSIQISYDQKSYDGKPAFVVVGENAITEQDIPYIRQLIADGGTLVIRDFDHNAALSARLYRSMNADIDHGMGFSNSKAGVFAGLRHLPSQEFQLCFKS